MNRTRIIGALSALALAAGIATAAAVPAMAATTSCPPGSLTCSGGQTNLSATVNDVFVVQGFPTAVQFAPVGPGAVTAGAASVYDVETNHATGYNVTVAIDPADEAQNDGYLTAGCPNLASQTEDIMRGPGCSYIPLTTNPSGPSGAITVQHATNASPPVTLGPVQTLASDGSAPVVIVTTSGPDPGTTQYADEFTLAIPGGTQASGAYTGTLDYVLSENP